MQMSADTSSSITVLLSSENSASDIVEDEHGQINTAPCTDTLDIDKPISLEELAADTHSFTPQSSSTSPPPLSISPIQILNGHKSKSGPRPPPFTLFIERQDDEARNFVSSTDTLDNNLLILFPQSEEEPSVEGLSFTIQTPSCSPSPLSISSMQTLSGRRTNTSPRPPPLLGTTENSPLNSVDTEAAAKSKQQLESMYKEDTANRLGSPQFFIFPLFDRKKNSGFLRSIIHYIFYNYLFALLIFIFTFVFIFHLFFLH